MKILIFIFGLFSVSSGHRQKSRLQSGHLQPIYLREESEKISPIEISAKIGEIQDFYCPDDQVFRLYMVSYEAYRECNLAGQMVLHKCNTPWKENKVR